MYEINIARSIAPVLNSLVCCLYVVTLLQGGVRRSQFTMSCLSLELVCGAAAAVAARPGKEPVLCTVAARVATWGGVHTLTQELLL